MKKLKLSLSKNKSSKVKIRHSGLHPAIAVPLIILVAIGGIITLKFSLADSNIYGVQIVMHDAMANKNIPGIRIDLTPYNASNISCTVMVATTDNAGSASIYGCPPSLGYIAHFSNLASIGYEARGQVLGGGTQQITNITVLSGNATQGNYSSYVVNIYPIDTDGDGVPNNTAGYPVDKCPTVAGLTSNNGCPAPALAPAAPAPAAPQPAPSGGGSTTKKPTTAAKTTVPASNTKSAPPVVVATTGDTTPPAAPQNLTISQIDQSLFLSWDESSDNVVVAGYNIERSTDDEDWSPIATKISDTFYTDEELNNSEKHYYYRVQAVDTAGNISEGILNDIELVSANKSSNTKSTTIKPTAKKKSSVALIAGMTTGIIMILVAILAAFALLRRRLANSQSPYYDSDISPSSFAGTAATTMPQQPLQPNPTQQPRYDVGPPAEHTAVSLKEMVMENREKHNHNQN